MKKYKYSCLCIIPLFSVAALLVGCSTSTATKLSCSLSTNNLYFGQTASILIQHGDSSHKEEISKTIQDIASSFVTVSDWSNNKLNIVYNKVSVEQTTEIEFNIPDFFETKLFLQSAADKSIFDGASSYIDNLSFAIAASGKNIFKTADTFLPVTNSSGIYQTSVGATGWLIRWLGSYKYYLLTNWHFACSVKDYNFSSFGYNFGTNNINSYYKFASCVEIGHGKVNTWAQDLGTDSFIYEVDFGATVTNSDVKTKLDGINSAHSPNDNLVTFATSIPATFDSVYVGGYPRNADLKYICTTLAVWDYLGYKDKDRSSKQQGNTISHFVDKGQKLASIANEIVTQEITRAVMSEGASGSMAVIWDGLAYKVVGIWWGYWSLYEYNTIAGSIESFVDYSKVDDVVSDEISKTWYPYGFGDLFTIWN
ncbi:MAG: hypothetical protein LBV22_01710 [Mycoplasmataceae bacterium]|nr:hypothetical protein [Mycoplasmataceae bacterium]